MDERKEEVFIVYATESPTYPSRAFGGRYITYPQPNECTLFGSVLILSGGILRTGNGPNDHESILPSGLIQAALGDLGKLFAENTVAGLVPPDARVMVVVEDSDMPLDMLQDLGFRASRTGSLVVGRGTGRGLRRLRWLRNAWAWGYSCVFTGHGPESPFEQSIMESLQSGRDVDSLIKRFWKKSYEDPPYLGLDLERCDCVCALGGLEGQDVFINRTHPEPLGLADGLVEIAEKLNVSLYHAGTLADLESLDWFEHNGQWRVLPYNWTRLWRFHL